MKTTRRIERLLKDPFKAAYIECMFWTNSGEPDDDLNDVGAFDLAPATVHQINHDCASFKILAGSMIEEKGEEQAGHDFWLTRCGHGTGFWDGDWPDHGDDLTKLCELFGGLEPYMGDDGKIYF